MSVTAISVDDGEDEVEDEVDQHHGHRTTKVMPCTTV